MSRFSQIFSIMEKRKHIFDLIQWWTEIIMQLRVLPQILSQVLANIQNAKKKRNKWQKNFFFYIIQISDAGVPPRHDNKCT